MTLWRVFGAASSWLVLCLSLWATDSRPAIVALAGVVAVVAAMMLTVMDVARDIGDTGWPQVRRKSRPSEGDQWVRQLRSQMIGAQQTGSTELHARLVTLIDARMSGPHDDASNATSVATDHALSPALRDLQTGASRRLGSLRTLEHIITDIEAL